MKTTVKLILVSIGFYLANAAVTTKAKAEKLAVGGTRECHGTGTCFVTSGGTTINGKWVEVKN